MNMNFVWPYFIALLAYISAGWPLQPIVNQHASEGQFVGAAANIHFGQWTPIAEMGYGFDSRRLSYQVGVQVNDFFSHRNFRVHDLWITWDQWPGYHKLQAHARQGLRLGGHVYAETLGSLRFEGFSGQLSHSFSQQTPIHHMSLDWNHRADLGYETTLQLSSNLMVGLHEANRSMKFLPFASSRYGISVSVKDWSMHVFWGMQQKDEKFKLLMPFSSVVPGHNSAISGAEFWRWKMVQQLPVFESHLNLFEKAPGWIRKSWQSTLGGEFFWEAAGSASQTKWSWGFNTHFTLERFRLMGEMIITHEGKFSFSFGW